MSVINGIGAAAARIPVDPTGAPAAAGSGSFMDAIGSAVSSLNATVSGADSAMASIAAGGTGADMHQVLLQMQEAQISISTATAVRDRLIEAYAEISRLNI